MLYFSSSRVLFKNRKRRSATETSWYRAFSCVCPFGTAEHLRCKAMEQGVEGDGVVGGQSQITGHFLDDSGQLAEADEQGR